MFESLIDNILETHQTHNQMIIKRGNYHPEDAIGRVHFAKEFRTILFSPGRQTGKTSYIVKNYRNNDLIITINYNQEKEMIRLIQQTNFNRYKPNIINSQKFMSHYYYGERGGRSQDVEYNRVWIDNYSYINKENINFMYENIRANQYIGLG
jgi:hypothetical protein